MSCTRPTRTLLLSLLLAGMATPSLADKIKNPIAVFDGLDKITGKVTSFDAAVGETVQFGALQVTPRACYTHTANEAPQTDAFLEVDEITLTKAMKRLFTGWMFAASPGLHAIEHPVYDVWLTDCKGGHAPTVTAGNPAGPGAEPGADTGPGSSPGATTVPDTGSGDLFTQPADPNAPVD